MQQPASDKLMGMEWHDGGLAGAAGGPVEKDVSMFVIADEAFGGKRAALDVAGKVTQSGAAAAGVLKLNIPGLGR
jgi:hypothetical protein